MEDKLIALVERLEEAGTRPAPEALDALVRAVQIGGTVQLMGGAVAGAFFLASLAVIVWLLAKERFNDAEGAVSTTVCALSGLVTVACFSASNVWVKYLDSVAYVAREALL
tara:strand:- start:996 stop:1328 length:333 start_codon:yes stop_codon:yes gene_type:complete